MSLQLSKEEKIRFLFEEIGKPSLGLGRASQQTGVGELIRPLGSLAAYPVLTFEVGSLIEWGMPQGGRDLLLNFLSSRFQEQASSFWTLWVNTYSTRQIYPPAWDARGIDLQRVRFADTAQPLSDLRPAFHDSFFKIIVLDAKQGSLSDDECAYLSRQARRFNYLIFIVRSYFLSSKSSLVWAKARFNVVADHHKCVFTLKSLRGPLHHDLSISSKRCERDLCLLP